MKRIAPNPSDLAFREYWDNFGYEQESMTLQQKILRLGVFVKEGGKISDVLDIYLIGRDNYDQLRAIQWMIFRYLTYMINGGVPLATHEGGTLAERIRCLDKEELIELLELELDRCVTLDPSGNYEIDYENLSRPEDMHLYNIERRHWLANPDETVSAYFGKSDRWGYLQPPLWNKQETK